MSLIVYDYDSKSLPDGIIADPNAYFDVNTTIPNDPIVIDVLKRVEHVTRISDMIFLSDIHPDWGPANCDNLSSGCKTFLNVYTNPDICFGLMSCGKNFRDEILKLNTGRIVWLGSFESDLMDDMTMKCDIEYEGKHFDRIGDFFWEVWD